MSKLKEIRTIAEEEIRLEDRRALIDAEKERIRRHVPLWHRLFPFVITIKRRSTNGS